MRYTELLKRIRAEYMEMPGLRVTIAQGQRLFGLEWTLCQTVFMTGRAADCRLFVQTCNSVQDWAFVRH